MRSLLRLQTLFNAVTSLSISALSVTGCAGHVGDGPAGGDGGGGGDGGSRPGIDHTGFTLNVCDGAEYHPLAGVIASTPVDYLELRRVEPGIVDGGSDAGPPAMPPEATEGTPCKTATDPSGCAARLSSARSSTGWGDPAPPPFDHPNYYLVYTRGDEVGIVPSIDALTQFLAPLANVKSAALLASQQGSRFDCSRNNARRTSAGFELITNTGQECGGTYENLVSATLLGVLSVEQTERTGGEPNCAIGRRPEGFTPTRAARAPRGSALGAYFAEVAELEAASVYAFERLRRELRAHGAPEPLVSAARDAERDEVRHTNTTKSLAERFGATFRPPRVETSSVRSLFEIALENAVEGCVRETFGALQARYQATHANDRMIARAMRVIAEDETRHAALAWDIAEWIEPLLSADERARIAEARSAALESLARDLETSVDEDVAHLAGVPTPSQAAWLLSKVRGELWAA